jgi:hypothetical protein
MTVQSNIEVEVKKTSLSAKELSDRELDLVVGGLNPQPLPPRRPTY